MKVCPQCRISYEDGANVCGQCGTPLVKVQYTPTQPQPTAYRVDATDHTAEFSPEDISQNKVLAMVPYLIGWIGIIITLLASGTSPYAGFHVRQALKIQICSALSLFLLLVPVLGWIVMGIYAVVTVIINLVCFFDVCRGMAREPMVISKFSFLR